MCWAGDFDVHWVIIRRWLIHTSCAGFWVCPGCSLWRCRGSRGSFGRWRGGARTYPMQCHCWVNLETFVLNDLCGWYVFEIVFAYLSSYIYFYTYRVTQATCISREWAETESSRQRWWISGECQEPWRVHRTANGQRQRASGNRAFLGPL